MHKFNILEQFDHVIWCGDLNYRYFFCCKFFLKYFRIDLHRDEVVALSAAKEWEKLYSADQLAAQRNEGEVFYGFTEGSIEFPPTYKYKLGCREYDTGGKVKELQSWF